MFAVFTSMFPAKNIFKCVCAACPNMKNSGKAPAGKAPAKMSGTPMDSQKKKKKMYTTDSHMFRSTIKRIARANSPDPVQLSSASLEVLCGIAMALVENIAETAGDFAEKIHKQTIGADDILAAVEVIYRGELKQQAIGEIKDALAKASIKQLG